MKLVSSAVRRVAHLVWSRRVSASLHREDSCRLFGLDLVIAPGVLHPRHFSSSRLVAQHLMKANLRGLQFLDLGTGSGLLGLIAANNGAIVTAVDINPAAVACARANANRNALGDRVSVAVSDVFETVPSEPRFDVVVTNPPFYPRRPRSLPDHAFAAGTGNGFFAKLAEGLPGRLAENGRLLLVHSSDADFAPVKAMLGKRGLNGRTLVEKRGFFETLTLLEFSLRELA